MEQDMRYVYQIYRDKSFSKAAEHLFMTQPSLSIAVRREEKRIGASLLDRSERPLQLTQAGEAYIRAVERMQYLEGDLDRELGDLRDVRTGRLHIGGTHYLNCFVLAGLLSEFSRDHPGVHLEVSEDSSVRLAKRLEQRELDLIFSCATELIQRFEHQPVFYDHILLAVPRKTPVPTSITKNAMTFRDIGAKRHLSCPKLPLEHFRELEFILLQKGNNLHDRSVRMFSEAGFESKVKLALSQLVTAYRFADQGLGATFVSDRIVCAAPLHNLLFYAINSPQVDRLFHVLLPPRDYTAQAVRAFIGFAMKSFQVGTGQKAG